MMIEVSALNSPHVAHGFFGRTGGVSQGMFASLNCGLGSGDDRAHVLQNRGIVAARLGGREDQLVTAHQVHSAQAVIVSAPMTHEERPKLDGLVTNVPGLILGTLTADCGPVLFADHEARIIGAAHAGWKGALHGVTDATVLKMEELGARRGHIIAALGPTISQSAYEVGPEFIAAFPEDARSYFKPSTRSGHHMFDLPGYLTARMRAFGIGQVINTGLCTYSDAQAYYSYRRATHLGEGDYGRQIAAITLR